jgi:hypothetical protein
MSLIARLFLRLFPIVLVALTAFFTLVDNQQRWLQSFSPGEGVVYQFQDEDCVFGSLIIPFHNPAGNALKVEYSFVFAPEKKLFKQKVCQCYHVRDSLHGRRIFPIAAGVALMLRNTSFRFLQHSWLMHLFLRC